MGQERDVGAGYVSRVRLLEKKLIYDRFTTILDTRNKGGNLHTCTAQPSKRQWRAGKLGIGRGWSLMVVVVVPVVAAVAVVGRYWRDQTLNTTASLPVHVTEKLPVAVVTCVLGVQ